MAFVSPTEAEEAVTDGVQGPKSTNTIITDHEEVGSCDGKAGSHRTQKVKASIRSCASARITIFIPEEIDTHILQNDIALLSPHYTRTMRYNFTAMHDLDTTEIPLIEETRTYPMNNFDGTTEKKNVQIVISEQDKPSQGCSY